MALKPNKPAKSSSQRSALTSPQNNEDQASVHVQQSMRFISGPMPSADELARYEDVLPGSAERFLQIHENQINLVETQAVHRQSLEKKVIWGDSARATAGMVIAALICFSGIALAYTLGIHGHDYLAGVILAVDLVGLTSVFIYGTNSRKAERKDRLQVMAKMQAHDLNED